MKLNEVQLEKFVEIFEIKANSVILIEKESCMTVIINGVIILNLRKELFKEVLLNWNLIFNPNNFF